MKSFEILRKLKRGCTQENWVVCVKPIKVMRRDMFLHTLFINGSPLKKTVYEKYEEYNLDEYGTFINKYNGVSMFSGSLIVFAYNFTSTAAKFKPDDIAVMNGILKIADGIDRLYIGMLGDFVFSLKKDDTKVYCTKRGSDEDIYSWKSFDEFFVFMYKSLEKLYDENGNKITPNKSKFPMVVNRTLSLDEVLEAHKLVEEEEPDEVEEEYNEEEDVDVDENVNSEEYTDINTDDIFGGLGGEETDEYDEDEFDEEAEEDEFEEEE